MPRSTPSALLLVDGYNVVGCWHEMKKIRQMDGLEAARRRLTEALINYSAYQGYETRIVFDAQYRDCPSNREVITPDVSVWYTDFGQTADTLIEKTCAAYRNDLRKFHAKLLVATNDSAQRNTVVGYGAICLSVEELAAEVDQIALKVQQRPKTNKRSTNRLLSHSLDPIAHQRLSAMRFGKPLH